LQKNLNFYLFSSVLAPKYFPFSALQHPIIFFGLNRTVPVVDIGIAQRRKCNACFSVGKHRNLLADVLK